MVQSPLVVIVGAGFSGTAVAIHLLRDPALGVARIVQFERPGRGLGGVAYDVESPHLRLNVPARRMSLFADAPDDFLAYLRERDDSTPDALYAQRREFRDYLAARLGSAVAAAEARTQGRVSFERASAEVRGVSRDADGRLLLTAVTSGHEQQLSPDVVLLATGNVAPRTPPWLDRSLADDVRVRDAWTAGSVGSGGHEETAVLVGTGLTTADLVVELRANGFDGRIVAISRHGLLPRVDDGPPPAFVDDDMPSACGDSAPAPRARELLRALRRHADAVAMEGRDWRSMINAVRERVPVIWAAMPHVERARFLRHVRSYWEVHRHRMPIALARKIGAEIGSGRLEIVAGRVLHAARRADGRIDVVVRERGAEAGRAFACDRVVNCTGAGSGAPLLPPWPTLLAHGAASRDPLGLGVLTDDGGRLLDANGAAARDLFYAGPLWRAQHWEATAVPDLRGRIHAVADAIRERLVSAAAS